MYRWQESTPSGLQGCHVVLRLLICLGCVSACWLVANPQVAASETQPIASVAKAKVVALDDVQLRAKEIGVLASLRAAEGTNVKKGDVLGVVVGSENQKRVDIVAPFQGIVVKTFHQAGARVKADQPVIRLVRLDRMVIEGDLNLDEQSLAGIRGKKARAQCRLGPRDQIAIQGKVTFASPKADTNGNYHVRVEVPNSQKNGRWLLRPGQIAKLEILDDER
jgi:multidrug efflux pump subunit AcrA (membrane-fusion protein)